jgi:hypothetical protein
VVVRKGVVAGVVVLLVFAWALFVGWSALSAYTLMVDARASTMEAREALRDADFDGAHGSLTEAAEDFATAEARLSSTAMWPLNRIVPIWKNLESARVLAAAGAGLTSSGLASMDVVAAAPGGISDFGPQGGRIPVDRIAALAGPLADALAEIDRAQAELAGLPSDGVAAPVLDARTEMTEALHDARGLVAPAAALTATLPGFLGADGPRRYLFVAQNPAELRGTGGFMGSFSLLQIEDGRMGFSPFLEIWDLPSGDLSALDPPTEAFQTRYQRVGGWGFWPNINFTPDFPSAATAMERLYDEVEGNPIDGVIATDPEALRALLELTGPVPAPEVGMVSADDVIEVVTETAYGEFDDEAERKEVLGGVAAAAFAGLLQGGVDESQQLTALDLLRGMSAGGHLKVHAADPDEQAVFAGIGVAGALPSPDGDVVGVSVNNRAANKADAFTSRWLTYRATLRPDGAVDAALDVEFLNETPTEGLASRVIGSNPPGRNVFQVDVFCASDCEMTSSERLLATTTEPVIEEELGYTVFMAGTLLESGERERLGYTWSRPGAWDPEGADGGLYSLTIFDQATLIPTIASVDIVLPEGSVVAAAHEDLVVDGGVLRWEGEVSTPRSLWVRLAADEGEGGEGTEASEPPPTLTERARRVLSEPLLRF